MDAIFGETFIEKISLHLSTAVFVFSPDDFGLACTDECGTHVENTMIRYELRSLIPSTNNDMM